MSEDLDGYLVLGLNLTHVGSPVGLGNVSELGRTCHNRSSGWRREIGRKEDIRLRSIGLRESERQWLLAALKKFAT